MKDKYYTPTKEEFYIGFEYEFSYGNDFKKYIYDGRQVLTSESYYDDHGCEYDAVEDDLKYMRVKYLDRSDIEDLGFNDKHYDGIQPRDTYFKIKTNDDVYQITVYWNMLRDDRENLVRIYKGKLHNYPYTEIFRGDIKNKSELKILLKQLNIK